MADHFQGPAAQPILTTPFARQYRSRIREAAQEPADFAGRYKVASWGCGGGCIQMALIDKKSGAVYPGPFRLLEFGGSFKFADGALSMSDQFEPLSYQLGSRLLIVRGCPDNLGDQSCALFSYEWMGDRFRLIKKVPAVPGPTDTQ